MQLKVQYSAKQLNGTIDYVAERNPYFKSRKEYIRESIMDTIAEIANGRYEFIGTMGYYVKVESVVKESIDNDYNIIFLEFYVDPGLGCDLEYLTGQ